MLLALTCTCMCPQAVYHMPTDDESAATSMALALQSLFYKVTTH